METTWSSVSCGTQCPAHAGETLISLGHLFVQRPVNLKAKFPIHANVFRNAQ